jgi:hypothetical protein
MIAKKQYFLFVPLSLVLAITSFAQRDPLLKPDARRELFHDYVDKEQLTALKSDGMADSLFTVSANEDVNFLVTYALVKKIDQLQYKIEKDTALGGQVKVRYIRGMERLLKDMNANWKQKRFAVAGLPAMLEAYWDCVETDRKGMTVEKIIDQLHYDIAKPVVNSTAFDANAGFKISKDLLVKKYCQLYPEQTFSTLRLHTDVPFADSLIKVAANKFPKQLYDYAAANNRLGALIRKIDDPLIKAVSRMATSSGSGQLYFPFLDNIISGKMVIADVDAVRNDSIQYYKLLVKTHLDYVERAINKDTARGFDELNDMLGKKARDVFVNTINGLHNESDAVRFRIIQPLNAQELYYLAVLSDGIIYTSSYTKGVFPLMMSRVNNKGDSLLRLVMFDKYRKFIKMAAGYNTLSTFLASFPDPENASALMRAFVGRLEKTAGLEDGVDVADSYASIAETIKPLADEMLMNVKLNYLRNVSQNNKRGIEIYNILEKLFLSADTTKKIDLTKELGIPPVYNIPFKNLTNDSGRVIMQVFFYGDKDGQNIFTGFQKMFNAANWKITPDKLWISISSQKGQPVTIYANRPLPEETGEDEKAQKALDSFLTKNKLSPTVVIHRGHSYYAPYTIGQIMPAAKIVFMGSCGGYHLIHEILKNAPDAHIIASKQIGKTSINRPFFSLLMEKVRNGNNIEWINFWKDFQQNVQVPGFEDYIPPHKNLGAIFIKAYKIAMGEEEQSMTAVIGSRK